MGNILIGKRFSEFTDSGGRTLDALPPGLQKD